MGDGAEDIAWHQLVVQLVRQGERMAQGEDLLRSTGGSRGGTIVTASRQQRLLREEDHQSVESREYTDKQEAGRRARRLRKRKGK